MVARFARKEKKYSVRTNLTEQKSFFIIGMPRGGTTIVSRVFNSLEDGFCLGEPHWFWQSWSRGMSLVAENCFDGIELDAKDIWDILPAAKRTDYNLVGYKETWTNANGLVKRMTEQHKDEVDFFLVVFRNPLMVHSSQIALGWRDRERPSDIVQAYKELDTLASHKNAIAVSYENFAHGKLDYLNTILPFRIEGKLELKPTSHKYGDPYANRSRSVHLTNRELCIPNCWLNQYQEAVEIWSKRSR